MITTGFLSLIVYLVQGLFIPLTVLGSIPTYVFTAGDTLGGWLWSINAFFPVPDLLIIMSLTFTYIIATFSVKTIKFVINVVRGSGA